MSDSDERPQNQPAAWYVYMVKCADDSLYTGITTDPQRRLDEHNGEKAAKYTRSRQPVELVYVENVADRSVASRRELEIKRLPRRKKKVLCEIYAIRP